MTKTLRFQDQDQDSEVQDQDRDQECETSRDQDPSLENSKSGVSTPSWHIQGHITIFYYEP